VKRFFIFLEDIMAILDLIRTFISKITNYTKAFRKKLIQYFYLFLTLSGIRSTNEEATQPAIITKKEETKKIKSKPLLYNSHRS
jgi:hypothetical protein